MTWTVDDLRAAGRAPTMAGVLRHLGLSLARSNYERVELAAAANGIDLPPLRATRKVRTSKLPGPRGLRGPYREVKPPSAIGASAVLGSLDLAPVERRRSPTETGEISEAAVQAVLLLAGFSVFMPRSSQARADLLIETAKGDLRVQVKTGRLIKGSIVFECTSSNWYTGTKTKYHDDVDLFAVYCPANGAVYLISPDGLGDSCSIAVTSKRQGGRRWASDYEVGRLVLTNNPCTVSQPA